MPLWDGLSRLQKEFGEISNDPPPGIVGVQPHPEDHREWHFVLSGPDDTPFQGGQYHGRPNFPKNYPFAPPSVCFITPSGKFEPNEAICLSMSNFHPEEWSPAWKLSTLLVGLLSFMTDSDVAVGITSRCCRYQKDLAVRSRSFNAHDALFCQLFPDCDDMVHRHRNGAPAPPVVDFSPHEMGVATLCCTGPSLAGLKTSNFDGVGGLAVDPVSGTVVVVESDAATGKDTLHTHWKSHRLPAPR